MSITVKLPDELAAILAGEAARRSLTLPVDTGALLAAAPEGTCVIWVVLFPTQMTHPPLQAMAADAAAPRPPDSDRPSEGRADLGCEKRR